jgi:TPR repeat protein
MPVDVLPLILGAGFLGTLVLTGVIAVFLKKRRRVWLFGLLFAAIWPAFYVWAYHLTEIRYSRAAAAGDVETMCSLGRSYLKHGRGSPYDPRQREELLRRAADGGYFPAQMTLGSYLLNGSDDPQDREEAPRWFRQAANQGNQEAKTVIDDMEQNGYDVVYPSGKAAQIVLRWLYD